MKNKEKKQLQAETYSGKISVKEKIGYGLGDFGCNMNFSSAAAVLPMYYTVVCGVGTGVYASVIMACQIMDAISDVIMGMLIDKTNSPEGKAKYWVIRFCVPLALAAFALFSVPASFTGTKILIWLFIFWNLMRTIGYTAVNVPYGSMVGYMTSDPIERGNLNTIRLIFAFACQLILNAVLIRSIKFFGGGDIYNRSGWSMTFAIIGILSIAVYVLHYRLVVERNHPSVGGEKASFKEGMKFLFTNRNWVSISLAVALTGIMVSVANASTTHFATFYLGNVDYYAYLANSLQLLNIFGLIFVVPKMIRKFGKVKTYKIGLPIVILGALISISCSSSVWGICAGNLVRGFGTSMQSGVNYSLIADAIDLSGKEGGAKYMGLGNATASFMLKMCSALGTLLWSFILNRGGFDPSLSVQSASGNQAILFTYLWVPVIVAVLNFIFISFFKENTSYTGK